MEPVCPCCGQSVSAQRLLIWFGGSFAFRLGKIVSLEAAMAVMLSELAKRPMTYEALIQSAYGRNEPPGFHGIIFNRISAMRKRLLPLGVAIPCRRGKKDRSPYRLELS